MSKAFDDAAKRFQSALVDMLGDDYPAALAVVTGSFVGLTLEVLRREGCDTSKSITIDGGRNRDITIHPRKD